MMAKVFMWHWSDSHVTDMWYPCESCDRHVIPMWVMWQTCDAHVSHVTDMWCPCESWQTCDAHVSHVTDMWYPCESCDRHVIPMWVMWQTCDTHVSHVTDNIFCTAVWLTSFFHLLTVHTYLSIQFTNGQDMYWRQLWVCGDCLSYPFRFKAVKDSFLVLTDTHFASKCISNCCSEWKAHHYRLKNPATVEGCCQLMCGVCI